MVFTDGSGTTGGPAGIAFVAMTEEGELHVEDALPIANATNQQAEILAAAFALHKLPPEHELAIISDSEYLVKGWNEYLPFWRMNNWRKKDGKAPKNIPHWQRLVDAARPHPTVTFVWTRGHVGTDGNERADYLANIARQLAKERSAA
jgi:ribonuclease HI